MSTDVVKSANSSVRGSGQFSEMPTNLTITAGPGRRGPPNTLQRPHPPIMIGGGGEQKTLRLVARYADACNLFDLPGAGFGADLRHKLDVLRRHCDDVGRDYDEIEKTCSSVLELDDDPVAGVARFRERLGDLADAGIQHVFVAPRRHAWDDAGLDAVAGLVADAHALADGPSTT